MVEIAYIVSAFNRPDRLRVCLSSLYDQSHKDWTLVVTDNSKDAAINMEQRDMVASFHDQRMQWLHTAHRVAVSEPYHSAEIGFQETDSEFVCYPCDDCYYVPEFGARMLKVARQDNLDLVMCNLIWNGGVNGPYCVMNTRPEICCCGKTSFILRRDRMIMPWPGKPIASVGSTADGQLIKSVVGRGARWGKCDEILLVQN